VDAKSAVVSLALGAPAAEYAVSVASVAAWAPAAEYAGSAIRAAPARPPAGVCALSGML
jgi:hypothetical protein